MAGRGSCEKPFAKAVVAGTFDRLHEGHRELLTLASRVANKLLVAVADGRLLLGKRLRELIEPFERRRGRVEEFLRQIGAEYEVVRIEDPVGPAGGDEELEAIVVSEETYPAALSVNRVRRERGLRPLVVVVLPMVLAEDGAPISSSRIRAGEIDGKGRRLSS